MQTRLLPGICLIIFSFFPLLCLATTFEQSFNNVLLSHPGMVYVLLMVGIYGLFFEFIHPGLLLPGLIGGIALIIALYALQLLPINHIGFSILVIGVLLMLAESYLPTYGVLGITGLISFILGSMWLLDKSNLDYSLTWQLILGMTITNAIFFFIIINMALRSQRKAIVSGKEALIGKIAVAQADFQQQGRVLAEGEMWQARCEKAVKRNDKVRIKAVDGLILIVEPID